jgi:hypothetical protein
MYQMKEHNGKDTIQSSRKRWLQYSHRQSSETTDTDVYNLTKEQWRGAVGNYLHDVRKIVRGDLDSDKHISRVT